MPPVSVLVKPASGACNMRCDYCFYCDETEKRSQAYYGRMSEQTLKNVIRKTLLRAEGAYSLAFQGGEPTLCGLPFFEKVVEYCRQYNRNGCRIQLALQTNGYALDASWAEFFQQNHFLVGLSVDGTREIHDKYRHSASGGATYDRVIAATRLLDQYQVDYNILTVIHRETAQNIRRIYRDYRKHGWNYLQFITCLDPLEEERGREEYSLLPETYGQFLIDLFGEWLEDLKKGREPFIRQFDNYVGILLGMPPESCEQRGSCGIQYVVEADGSVYPCDFYVLDDYRLGNFDENRMPEIDEKREELEFVARSKPLPEDCQSCPWHRLCRNGCYRCRLTAADVLRGAGPEGQNYFCESYRMFFEACHEGLQEAAEIYSTKR